MKKETGGFGQWLIWNDRGAEYLVTIVKMSGHRGGSFTGPYWCYHHDTKSYKYIGIGCFPMEEISEMKLLGR